MRQFFLQSEGVILVLISPFLLFPTVFVPGTAVALLALAILWLLFLISRKPWPVSPLNGALLLWSVTLLVGVLVSADPDLTLPKTTGLLLGAAILRYLTQKDNRDKRLKRGLVAFFAAGLVIIMVGAVSADWQFEVSLVESLVGWLPPRLLTLPEGKSVGVHMNQLAGAILPYPLIFISLLWGWRPSRQPGSVKALLVLLTILLLGLLFLAQSRSGWLGLFAGLISLFLMTLWWSVPRLRKWLLGLAVFGSAVLLIAAILFTNTATWQNLWQRPPQETVIGDLSTLDFRREVWLWGVTAVQNFPFTGTGLGTFRRVAPELYPIAVQADFDIAHSHNIFLQVALDTGLPGLVGYLGLLIVTGFVGWRAARDWKEGRPLILGFLASLIAIHAYGLGDALAPGSKPAIIFWLILGLINTLPQEKGANSSHKETAHS